VGKQVLASKSDLINDYNEYFMQLFLYLREKEVFQLKNTMAEQMYKLKVDMRFFVLF
jgi:hypothetical protein